MIDRSERNRWFSRRLIEAMGLGSLVGLPLAGLACGGSVAMSQRNTDGGSGGSDASSSGDHVVVSNDAVSSTGVHSIILPPGAGGSRMDAGVVSATTGFGGAWETTSVGHGGYGVTTAVVQGGWAGNGGVIDAVATVGQGGFGAITSATGAGGLPGSGGEGGGGLGCSPPVFPGYTLREGCFAASAQGCPVPGSVEASSSMAKVLGVCDSSVSFYQCCGVPAIAEVSCGFERGGLCCYDALIFSNSVCGPLTGRPFTAEGHARTAPAHQRSDWSASSSPATAALDTRTRRALAEAWTQDARYEHASIAAFARLGLELLAVGAPAELVRDAQRAMGDEIRHAELCFALAGSFAGAPVGPGSLALDGALGRVSLAEIAAAAVREGCVGETLAALGAADARDAATDPAVRAALDEIAADEAKHAAMSWRLVAWAFQSGGAEVRAAIEAAFAEPVDLGAECAPEGLDVAAYHAHGRLLPAEVRAHAARALADVVRPSAAALLGSFVAS